MKCPKLFAVGAIATGCVVACTDTTHNAATGNGGTFSAGGSSTSAPNGGNAPTGGNSQSSASSSNPTSGGTSSGSSVATGGKNPSTGGMSTNSSGGQTSSMSSSIATGGTPTSVGGTANAGGKSAAGGTTASTGGNATGGTSAAVTVATGGKPGVSSDYAIGGTHSGEATFYDSNGNGNCSYGTAVNGKDIAALNNPDYNMAAWCGACAQVTGPKGTVTVLIQDRCPECATGDLDLNPGAFDKIADHAAGRVKITWKFVPCDLTGPVSYHFKEGSSVGWTAVQVLNHRLPIAKFEYSTDFGVTWKTVSRVEYNYFIVESGFGPIPAQVRITASTGQVLVDQLGMPDSDIVVPGQANF
ncbi:MAG TPA: expansin EXLX1 family cellulose-binding protein [Polyangiaceae bacterium]